MPGCVARDLEQLPTLYDNPFWHCQNLQTTNPIKGTVTTTMGGCGP